MKKSLLLGLLIMAVAALTLSAQSGVAIPEIRPEAIRAHMSFLASDLLEGRGTGSRGHEIAAHYVAAQYEAMGLEPGNSASWFQVVPFRWVVPSGGQSSITLTRPGAAPVTLGFGQDFVSSGDPLREDSTAEGEVVFAGYGITAPEQKYDDYGSIDARGKIVAILSGAPKDFPNDLRAHHSSSLMKLDNAAAHGAIAILTFAVPAEASMFPWPRVVRQYKLGSMNWLESDGTPHATRREIHATASITRAGVEAIFGKAAVETIFADAEKGRPHAIASGVHATVHIVSRHSRVESPNVVGILRGSDPKLRDEYVVYSAHLDHLGISEPVDGDAINNGALDNASGIAAMLEIARVFAAAPSRPRRSILFLATTAEEKGLRGADYFANQPTVPVSSIVADINIDEILMFHPVKDVIPIGGEHSDLGDVAARAAQTMGLELTPDPMPQEVVFVRSDQYPFVRRGVPSIYVDSGFKSTDPNVDVLAMETKWIREIYHTPKDDMSQALDYRVGVQLAQFNYLIGKEVADRTERPVWKKGDFFGDTFGKQHQ
ncbi:MAG TPA: M28 family metallopeptidase [Thermoanaerobaculia bacterium]|nr:M28 family metallopeptidase [Thermoanaerobaculia bacterium]